MAATLSPWLGVLRANERQKQNTDPAQVETMDVEVKNAYASAWFYSPIFAGVTISLIGLPFAVRYLEDRANDKRYIKNHPEYDPEESAYKINQFFDKYIQQRKAKEKERKAKENDKQDGE